MTTVVSLAPTDTHALRRRVLRDDDPEAAVHWDGDDDPTTLHLGVVVEGGPIAVSTWLLRSSPGRPDAPARQLRGMATEPGARGRGLGSMLLRAGAKQAENEGATRLWANARIEAVGFYEHHGWRARGPVFSTPDTGLPHRLVTFELF